MKRIFIALILLAAATAAHAGTPTVFKLTQINLSNGWTVTGTVTTDGATGYLSAANIVDWNLTIVQTTDMVWNQGNSNDLNISGVSTDGKKIYVATSPDGFLDGGTLCFGRPGGPGQIPTNAYIADFTSLGYNLGYGMGGIAGWKDEIAGLNFVALNQQYNTKYPAAVALPTGLVPKAVRPSNVFLINVPIISGDPLMTMFGTIITDGTLGNLGPQNIKAWNVTARTQSFYYMTKQNSVVMAAQGLSNTGAGLRVDHAAGQFVIGMPGRRPTFVTLADFTDANYPNGFANYYMGNYGVMGDKWPLVGSNDTYYIVGQR
jgi:hypothetical protein